MRASFWKTGALALATVAGLGNVNNAQAKKDADLKVYFDPYDSNQCYYDVSVSCFDVKSDKNITHIFVDVDDQYCYGYHAPFVVTVNGYEVKDLHYNGGPCNHDNGNGQMDIDRDVWFPLQGNQKYAEVCVYTYGEKAPVTVGAKSANECEEANNYVNYCENCDKDHDKDRCDKDDHKY